MSDTQDREPVEFGHPCEFAQGCEGLCCIERNHERTGDGRLDHICAECCIMCKRAPQPDELPWPSWCRPCTADSGLPPLPHESELTRQNYLVDQRRAEERPIISLAGNPFMPMFTYDDDVLTPMQDWKEVDLEIMLDSGCCEHVMDSEDAPGYAVSVSPGSR